MISPFIDPGMFLTACGQAIANIREIRSMSFERVFSNQFNDSVDSAYRAGLIGGFAEGTTVGVAAALIYIAEGASRSSSASRLII